jgi:ribonuclease HII
MIARSLPTLDSERIWWRHGKERVAGVDEVGRGALAGPLIAAAVILPRCGRRGIRALIGLNDSKAHTPGQRERWFDIIVAEAVVIGIGTVGVSELDEVGLAAANRLAMERAVTELSLSPEVLLLDAAVTELPIPQLGLIDGDAQCLSIAAASVVAKVTRDRLMIELDAVDGRYGYAEHKGYGTARHMAALKLHGPSSLHRRCFAPVGSLLEQV